MEIPKTKEVWDRRAFSLLEVIGVIAIISVLLSVIVPQVMSAMRAARVSGLVLSLKNVETAVTEYYREHGRLSASGRIESTLMEAGVLDSGLEIGFADEAALYAVEAGSDHKFLVAGGDEFDLDGDGRTGNGVGADTDGTVVHARLTGVSEPMALELNRMLDGEELMADDDSRGGPNEDPDDVIDVYGKVIYDAKQEPFPTTVYIYITHW